MSEYLTKEEIRQWRSSLERITLEEYAARLGKKLEEEKETEDIGDFVMKNGSGSDFMSSYNPPVLEKIITIGSKAFSKEKEITSVKKFSSAEKRTDAKGSIKVKTEKTSKNKVKNEKPVDEENLNISFKKNLTDREQTVFEYFVSHKNCVVYAKELAEILGLPRDYVYKYIKNLRAKINEDALYNAENGGFVLKV